MQCARSSARLISRLLVSFIFACCTLFTAALASAMAEGDSSDDRGPAGSGKIRWATWKYDCSDVKLGCRSRKKRFLIPGKTADWWWWGTAWKKKFHARCAWVKKAKIFSRRNFRLYGMHHWVQVIFSYVWFIWGSLACPSDELVRICIMHGLRHRKLNTESVRIKLFLCSRNPRIFAFCDFS